MSWKDALLPASFRGVTFGVADAETLLGRRVVLHEYPLRDDPYGEDLGRKAREFTINAFVIGDNYLSARDALVAALESPGAGTLVHPTLGTKSVLPLPSRLTFKNTEGGIEYFQLTFVEAGSNSFPSSALDTSGFTSLKADAGISDFMNNFSQLFSVINFPDFLATNSKNNLIGSIFGSVGSFVPTSSSFVGILQNILQSQSISNSPLPLGTIPIGSLPTPDPTSSINYSTLQSSIQTFSTNAGTLISTPAPAPVPTSTTGGVSISATPQPLPLAASMTDLIVQLTQLYPNNIQTAIVAQMQLFNNFGSNLPSVPLTTTERLQEAINQQQLIDLVKNTALAEMARATSVINWASRQDALNTLNQILDLMEPQLLYLADNGYDSSYNSMNNIRVAMVKDVNTRASTLKNIKTVQTNYSIPALVFAYKQYGDASQESDVVARNKIRNPVFIPPLSQLEVLV